MIKSIIISIAILCSSGNKIISKELNNSAIIQHPIQSSHFGYWKVQKIEPTFKDHLGDLEIADYTDHINLMKESGFIEFLTDSTFVGNNGLIDLEGTYKLSTDSLFTKNQFGFQNNYAVLILKPNHFAIVSNQENLSLTIHYERM